MNRIDVAESMMNTNKRWQQHLSDQMGASLDPVVYAVRWARDPRCMQAGSNHRRVGQAMNVGSATCALWAAIGRTVWV